VRTVIDAEPPCVVTMSADGWMSRMVVLVSGAMFFAGIKTRAAELMK
jgi:hypothetical protein